MKGMASCGQHRSLLLPMIGQQDFWATGVRGHAQLHTPVHSCARLCTPAHVHARAHANILEDYQMKWSFLRPLRGAVRATPRARWGAHANIAHGCAKLCQLPMISYDVISMPPLASTAWRSEESLVPSLQRSVCLAANIKKSC